MGLALKIPKISLPMFTFDCVAEDIIMWSISDSGFEKKRGSNIDQFCDILCAFSSHGDVVKTQNEIKNFTNLEIPQLQCHNLFLSFFSLTTLISLW